MDDRLIMEDYLLVLKSTVEVYVHGTQESSNVDIRNTLKNNLNEILTSQAETYDLMRKNGWYPVNNIDKKEINKTLIKLQSQN